MVICAAMSFGHKPTTRKKPLPPKGGYAPTESASLIDLHDEDSLEHHLSEEEIKRLKELNEKRITDTKLLKE